VKGRNTPEKTKYLNFTAVFPLLPPQIAMTAESLISTSSDS